MREYARESESVVSRVRGEPIRAFEGRPFQACPCEVNKCPQRSPKKSATTTLETSDSSRACSHSLQPGLQEGKYDLRSSEPAGASNGWRDYKYKIIESARPTFQLCKKTLRWAQGGVRLPISQVWKEYASIWACLLQILKTEHWHDLPFSRTITSFVSIDRLTSAGHGLQVFRARILSGSQAATAGNWVD